MKTEILGLSVIDSTRGLRVKETTFKVRKEESLRSGKMNTHENTCFKMNTCTALTMC